MGADANERHAVNVIPAVDVLAGRVVRLQEGDFGRSRRYGSDPVAAAERWVEEGASLVHVVDLDGARTGRPDPVLWNSFTNAGVPYQIGGGIRSVVSAQAAVTAGARRVVLGTAAVWNPALFCEIIDALGPDRIVAAVDVRAGRALGDGWLDAGRESSRVLADLVERGARHVLVTSVNRDGTMRGPDLRLIDQIRAAAPSIAVIASGGVGSLDDLRSLSAIGASAAIVGRALYEERFTYQEAVEAASSAHNAPVPRLQQ